MSRRKGATPLLAPVDAPDADSPLLRLAFPVVIGALLAAQVAARGIVNGEAAGFGINLLLALLLGIPVILAGLAEPLLRPTAFVSLPRAVLAVPLLLFALLVALSPFHADSPYAAAATAVPWVAQVALFLLLVGTGAEAGRARIAVAVFLATAVALAGLGLHQRFIGFAALREQVNLHPEWVPVDDALRYEFMTRLGSDQPFATFVTANSLAGYLAIAFPALLGWLADGLRGGRPVRAAGLALRAIPLLVAGVTLGLTQSKGGLLALAAALAVMFVLARWGGMGRAGRGLVALAATGGAAVLALVAFGVVDPLGLARPASSMGFRGGYWLGAWEVFREHWLAGVGLDGFADHYVRFKSAVAGETQRAHNDWLQIAAELGVVGFAAYVLFWGVLLARSARGLLAEGAQAEASPPPPARLAWAAGGISGLGAVVVVAHGTHCFDVGTGPALEPALLGLWGLTFCVLWAADASGGGRYLRCGLVAGVTAFLVHGLVDLDAYVHQVGEVAWLAAGALVALDRSGTMTRPVERAPVGRVRWCLGLGLAAAALAYIAVAAPVASRLVAADARVDQARTATEPDMFEAVQLLEEARALAPWNPGVWRELARAYHRECLAIRDPQVTAEQVEEIVQRCVAAADGAVARDPWNAGLRFTRGCLEYDHAKKWADLAAAAGAGEERRRLEARQRAAFKEAAASFLAAAVLYPSRAEYRFRHGLVLDEGGDWPGARREYLEALYLSEINPLGRLRLTPETAEFVQKRLREGGR